MMHDKRLATVARKAREATVERDRLICELHESGRWSLRALGECAGLSHAGVRKIVEKSQS